MKLLHLTAFFCIAVVCSPAADTLWTSERLPPLVRMVRIYGTGDEQQPPVLLIQSSSAPAGASLGSLSLTIELDVAASVPPDLVAVLQHCTATWEPDNNPFTLDPTAARAVVLDWRMAPPQSRYYTHRAVVQIPSPTLRVPVGGNWKVLFYELGREQRPLAEARFFAIEPAAECMLTVLTDFYQPRHRAAPSARILEASVGNVRGYTDAQITTAVFYRMHRWYEPLIVRGTQGTGRSSLSLRSTPTTITGLVGGIKRFRIEGIPCENDYRRLDAQNPGLFPRSTTPIRLPMADLRRRGQFGLWSTSQAAMLTSSVAPSDDEYVPIEFILDPENLPVPNEDVFVVGSMNSWHPSPEWMMIYDSTQRYYRLRQWVRRGQHAYMYATGHLDADTGSVRSLSFEEFEGNNSASGHTFVAFIYARSLQAGGYDTIIAACSGTAL
ncbi:MAG: hypothetical protein KatS3mg039_0158 [Candidatus Kapaibacterium sp.]|nr:MAG: hypothetical protein KatS3mg039_0158 [Candidatus Kapabacteria bacterium]